MTLAVISDLTLEDSSILSKRYQQLRATDTAMWERRMKPRNF
jgi:hypothetical protein